MGTYAYYLKPGGPGFNEAPYVGKFIITYASPDSIKGLFYARNHERPSRLGGWNLDAYVVYGMGATVGFINALRISRSEEAANILTCIGRHNTNFRSAISFDSYISDCQFTFESSSTAPIASAIGHWASEFAQNRSALYLDLDQNGSAVTGEGSWSPAFGSGDPFFRDFNSITGTQSGSTVTLSAQTSAGTVQIAGTVTAFTMDLRLTGAGFTGQQTTVHVR